MGPGEVAADVAELDFDVAPPVLDALRRAVRSSDLGYPDFTDGTPVRLKDAFAQYMGRGFGWQPDPGRVELCSQVVQGLCCSILAYTDPGDAVVTHAPTYLPIRRAIEHLGRRCVTVPVEDLQDVAQLRDAVSTGLGGDGQVKMIVLCQPHNPTGHVFDERTLSVLGCYAETEDVVVFSDEIHQDLTLFSVTGRRSPAATEGLAQRLVTFTSAAKSFNIAGVRCAVGHFGSPRLHAAFCRLPWHLRDGASLLGVTASLAAWENGGPWLRALRAQLLVNRQMIVEALGDVPAVRWTPPNATYLAWLDLTGSVAAKDPRQFFIDRARLYLQAGSDFGPEFGSFARLNFGTSASTLAVILERLGTALAR